MRIVAFLVGMFANNSKYFIVSTSKLTSISGLISYPTIVNSRHLPILSIVSSPIKLIHTSTKPPTKIDYNASRVTFNTSSNISNNGLAIGIETHNYRINTGRNGSTTNIPQLFALVFSLFGRGNIEMILFGNKRQMFKVLPE